MKHLTYEEKAYCDDVRRRLNEYLEEHPINLAKMARIIGMTKSVLNKFATNYQPYVCLENIQRLDKYLEERYH